MKNVISSLSLIVLLFSACSVIGPQTEKKSSLNYLSGEHYKAKSTLGGVIPVVVERVKKDTVINGNCFFRLANDNFKYPVKFQKIGIFKGTKQVGYINTDTHGKFSLHSYLVNGTYTLKIISSHYLGEASVKVSSYMINNIDLLVSKI